MTVKTLAPVALLLLATVPTASADAEEAAIPPCWLHTEDVLGPNPYLYDCILPCLDGSCTTFPWNRDPLYYLPGLEADATQAVGDGPECWVYYEGHSDGKFVDVDGMCLVDCPDHTCSSYPFDRDPLYYLPDLDAAS